MAQALLQNGKTPTSLQATIKDYKIDCRTVESVEGGYTTIVSENESVTILKIALINFLNPLVKDTSRFQNLFSSTIRTAKTLIGMIETMDWNKPEAIRKLQSEITKAITANQGQFKTYLTKMSAALKAVIEEPITFTSATTPTR